jgi:hypothetical protein
MATQQRSTAARAAPARTVPVIAVNIVERWRSEVPKEMRLFIAAPTRGIASGELYGAFGEPHQELDWAWKIPGLLCILIN